MKTITLKSIIYILALIQLSSCSSTKVISDKDSTEDFTQFKTFEYYGWTDSSDQILSRFDKERIEAAFADEGRKRGLTRNDSNGDVIVVLFVTGEIKTQTTAQTNTMGVGGMSGRGRGMGSPGWGWGATQSHTVINETNYLVGTLMIEMYDKQDQKLIWQAIGTKTISENPKKRESGIPKKVAAIMREYPVQPIKD
jgi:Domain of unknown function (DUF4136)